MTVFDEEHRVPGRCLDCGYYSRFLGACELPEEDKLLSCPLHNDVPGNDYFDPDPWEVFG